MRTALLLTLLCDISRAGESFGAWRLDTARSTLVENWIGATLRIEPHARGEVFTLDTLTADGRASTFSTILYLDGRVRKFQNSTCTGTQLSRRLDSGTVEIVRECAGGQVRLLRRTPQGDVLILEITERNSDGHRSERRLVMQRQ